MESDLEELQKKIYQRGSQMEDRPRSTLSRPLSVKPEGSWKSRRLSFLRRTLWLFILAFIIIAGGLAFLFFGTSSFSEDNIRLTIDVPEEVSGIEVVAWRVTVENTNRIALEEAELFFEYPSSARPIDDPNLTDTVSRLTLGTIEGNQSLDRVFEARLFGEEDEVKRAKARLRFSTAGIARELEIEAEVETKITSLPLIFEAEGPDDLLSGEEGSWVFTFRNDSDTDIPNLRVRIEYPEGFSLTSTDPPPHFDSKIWEISSLKIGQERAITLRGILTGSINDRKTFQAFLEVPLEENRYASLARKIFTTEIVLSPLTLTVRANGQEKLVAKAGDEIAFEASFRNNITEEMNDIVVELDLLGEMLDLPSVESEGNFDVGARRVTWNEVTSPFLKRLSPGETKTVTLSFEVNNTFSIKSFSDKNFSIRLVTRIRSDNPPGFLTIQETLREEEFVIPIATEVDVKVTGDYRGGPFTNTGGIPPSVGKQTTYTVYWRVTNTSNDIKDFEILATLPSWASFTGLKRANFDEETLFYDSEKRRVVWNIDRLPATTGFALPVYEAAFQIGVSPGSEHVGQIIDIIGSSQVKGIDSFTNEIINFLVPPIKTDLGGKLREGQAKVIN